MVVVRDFIVGFTTLLSMDNNNSQSLEPPYSTVTDFAKFLG